MTTPHGFRGVVAARAVLVLTPMSTRIVILSCLLVGCGRMGFDPLDGSGGGGGVDGGGGGGDGGPGLDECGVDGDSDCGVADKVPGGTFLRGNSAMYPATVSAFELDRFEVTVGRFREFIEAKRGIATAPPDEGAGAHVNIPDSGWSSAWNTQLEPETATLRARLLGHASSTFTDAPADTDNLPINWVTWYEAFAFCIWDGGRLPTHAEAQFARLGGEEQRVYPWTADPSKITPGHVMSGGTRPEPVGSRPSGAGRWGHLDLVGNVDEWSLDFFGTMPMPCRDCVVLESDPVGATRLLQGHSFLASSTFFAASPLLHGSAPANDVGVQGFRCAR